MKKWYWYLLFIPIIFCFFTIIYKTKFSRSRMRPTGQRKQVIINIFMSYVYYESIGEQEYYVFDRDSFANTSINYAGSIIDDEMITHYYNYLKEGGVAIEIGPDGYNCRYYVFPGEIADAFENQNSGIGLEYEDALPVIDFGLLN